MTGSIKQQASSPAARAEPVRACGGGRDRPVLRGVRIPRAARRPFATLGLRRALIPCPLPSARDISVGPPIRSATIRPARIVCCVPRLPGPSRPLRPGDAQPRLPRVSPTPQFIADSRRRQSTARRSRRPRPSAGGRRGRHESSGRDQWSFRSNRCSRGPGACADPPVSPDPAEQRPDLVRASPCPRRRSGAHAAGSGPRRRSVAPPVPVR